MGKMSLLIGAGVGYVLGTRAGRGQYDRMVAEARKLWRDPRVQRTAQQAQDQASDLGRRAEEQINDTMGGRSADGTAGSVSTGPSGTGPTTPGGTSTGSTGLPNG